jgi:hypothetical protein
MPEMQAERKPFLEEYSTYFSPHRRGFRVWITRRQQQLRLMCMQDPRWFGARRPPLETSL